ncbi:SET domain-containing protein [Phlyctema vagabunda]|uniref:SET domain-containing protein n=1 Tax=Phlyctema vagabunda TaxID=108571 RepID=A0ABR4PKG7_9HELO
MAEFQNLGVVQHINALLQRDVTSELYSALICLSRRSSNHLAIEVSIRNNTTPRPSSETDIESGRIILGEINLGCNTESWAMELNRPSNTYSTRVNHHNIDKPQHSICDGSVLSPVTSRHEVAQQLEQPLKMPTVQDLQVGTCSKDCTSDPEPNQTRTTTQGDPAFSSTRQIHHLDREFPQRKKRKGTDTPEIEPSSVDKFIVGIWKQIFSSIKLGIGQMDYSEALTHPTGSFSRDAFRTVNQLCAKVSISGRSSRALEIIIQAFWVDCFDSRVSSMSVENLMLSKTEVKMATLREACAVLGWSEKELRNRLAIWRGYRQIRDAGGWVSLAFAGPGIYRFCKYRIGFEGDLLPRLKKMQPSLEVAADTLHPQWRGLLKVVGHDGTRTYSGHPHDWVVNDGCVPVQLASTYTQWDENFEFQHLRESIIDKEVWPKDPRGSVEYSTVYCTDCGFRQSDHISINECACFPEVFGSVRPPVPVQVMRAGEGRKNNGLVARCAFERGTAIGEFVGLITKGLSGVDVMEGGYGERQYQIFQKRVGNYTRFINHSCAPNSQVQRFSWLGLERIIVVSKGIKEGEEITVDYSHKYWEDLDKICLCGEACCRYSKERLARST